jgi:hypothetical protein
MPRGSLLRLADSTLARGLFYLLGHVAAIRGADRVAKHLIDKGDVLRLLHQVVERAGSQSAWAKQSGVDRPLLNQVLKGKRPLPPTILKALKLKKVVAYERGD